MVAFCFGWSFEKCAGTHPVLAEPRDQMLPLFVGRSASLSKTWKANEQEGLSKWAAGNFLWMCSSQTFDPLMRQPGTGTRALAWFGCENVTCCVHVALLVGFPTSSHPRNHRSKQSKCVPTKVRTWAYLLFCTLPHPQDNILVIFKRHCLQDTGLIKLQQRRWGRHHAVFWAASAACLCLWAACPCFLLLPSPALFLAALLPCWLPSSLANLLRVRPSLMGRPVSGREACFCPRGTWRILTGLYLRWVFLKILYHN